LKSITVGGGALFC